MLGEGHLRFATVGPGREGSQALFDGWANVLLLSKADAIVGTSRSSFALLAAGLNGGGSEGEGGGGVRCTTCSETSASRFPATFPSCNGTIRLLSCCQDSTKRAFVAVRALG